MPWGAGVATGIGSMPGEDIVEALRVVLGELPDLPYLPELPARGPGADLVGRTAGALVDLHVDLQPSGWRLVDRPGRDVRRARDLAERDLDALQEVAGDHRGPLKVQIGGPWTLAASVELPRGDRALSDRGACRDLTESLAEGVRLLVGEVRRRVPGAHPVLQLDEPSLPAVLAGRIPTASGYGTLRVIDEPEARAALALVTSAGGVPVVLHCCALDVPVGLAVGAGMRAVSFDAGLVGARLDDQLGAAVDAGLALFCGLVPATAPATAPANTPATASPAGADRLAAPARALWRRLGFAPESLPERIVVTPTCGQAGASPDYARRALRLARETAGVLAESPE